MVLCWVIVWSSAAPVRVTLGQTGDAATVDVPLIRGLGDPRPRVEVHLAEDERPVLAVVDLGTATIRIGSATAARLGLQVRHDRVDLDQLRIGEVLVDGPTAESTRTDELTIGVGALPGLGVAVLVSLGVVRFSTDTDALLASVGTPFSVERATVTRWRERGTRVEGTVADAVPGTFQGSTAAEGLLRLRSDRRESTIGAGVLDADEVRRGGPAVRASIALPTATIPASWVPRDEAIADPRAALIGELGADALTFLDVAVGGGRMAMAEVARPLWTDAAAVRRGWLEAEIPDWEGIRARRGWAELADLRWGTGDVDGALVADAALEALAGDRCELYLAIGVRRLRAGAPGAIEALGQAWAAYTTWEALGPEIRDRVRYGRPLPDGVSSTRQPVSCEQARTLLAPLPSSEGALRARPSDPGVRAALAALMSSQRREVAWDPGLPDPHPLTTALILGPALVAAALERDPTWVAGQLAAAAWTVPGVAVPGAELARMAALHPGDPSVACQVALAEALETEATVPALPDADCLAASTLLAIRRGDTEIAAVTRSVLRTRWSDLVTEEPLAVVVRMTPQEEP